MKVKSIILSLFSFAATISAFVACEDNNQVVSAPSINLSVQELEFDKEGGSKTIDVFATRDWKAEVSEDWVSINPKSGKASETDPSIVEIKVLENTGLDRSATVEFTIGFEDKILTINQKGIGSAADMLIYANDFDKEEATKTYGTGSSWPYLDQFEGWKNEQGKGAGNVTYGFNGMSARSNSNSLGSYSDYEGSGKNNLFFGSNAYFLVQDIALNGNTNITLTFGTEKYSQDNGSVFTNSEFHIYLSADAKKWVELKDYTFAGGQTQGRWNVASATFSVPAGTEKLSICFDVDVASSYRLDDLNLSVAGAEGTAIDFTKGEEKDFSASSGSGSGSGGGTTGGEEDPSKVQQITCAEYIAKADPNTTYRLVGKVTSSVNTTYCSFDMNDGTATVVVWTVNNKDEWKDVVKQGGTVTVRGKYYAYGSGENIKHEMVDAYIEKFEPSTEKYLNLSTYTMDVSAKSTSAVFKIYSNDSWKVTTDNQDYKVSNPDGSGEATVTLTFPENTGEAKTIKVTVTPTDATLETKVLTLTHKKQGSTGDENTLIVDITDNQGWATGTDATYGAGYEISLKDFKLGYYKYESTSNAIAPSIDHIRVYKSSVLSIQAPSGKTIKSVKLNCTDASKCVDMKVIEGGNSAIANTTDLTISWSGSTNRFVAQAANGQVRVKVITVEFE